eukprot:ANDGO_00114.mRNA.1 Putative glycosyltransferase C06E1.7
MNLRSRSGVLSGCVVVLFFTFAGLLLQSSLRLWSSGDHQTDTASLPRQPLTCASAELRLLLEASNGLEPLEISFGLVGRLGNRIFELFSVIGTCLNSACSSIVLKEHPTDVYEIFPGLAPCVEPLRSQQVSLPRIPLGEKSWGVFSEDFMMLERGRQYRLQGYFQSWKYFQPLSSSVLRRLLNSDRMQPMRSHVASIKERHNVKCVAAVHVRRGDNVWQPKYWVADAAWLENAMKYLEAQVGEKCAFIVLSGGAPAAGRSDSEGISWCRSHIDSDQFLVVDIRSNPDPLNDLFLLAAADHAIITTGTFGWWGAYLNAGIRVACDNFYTPKAEYTCEDYFPPGWHLFDREFRPSICDV